MGATLAHGTELPQSKGKEPGKLLEFNKDATVLLHVYLMFPCSCFMNT